MNSKNKIAINKDSSEEDRSLGCGGYILMFFSVIILICTFPFSMCLCIKVVAEYERAVILRLGRVAKGGAKGPGLFFIIPCLDDIRRIDLRTKTFDVPPQVFSFLNCSCMSS